MGWLMGFEPTTTGITIQDSTAELQPPLPDRERDPDETCEPEGRVGILSDQDNRTIDRLAPEGRQANLACPTGFEPVTLSLEG